MSFLRATLQPAAARVLPENDASSLRVAISAHLFRWLPRVLLLGGSAAIGYLCIAANPVAVVGACAQAGPGIILVFLAPSVGLLLHTLAWRCLLPVDARPGLWASYRILLAAQAGNELGLGVLGEPIKVAALPRAHRRAALRAVLTDNLAALSALLIFLGFFGGIIGVTQLAAHALPLALGGAAVVVALAIILVHLRSRPLFAAYSTALHTAGKAWIVAEFALATALFGCHAFALDVLLGVSSSLASLIGAPVPGQVGVVESAVAGVAKGAGVSASTAVAIVLVRRARSCFWILIGGVFLQRINKANHRA